MAESTQAVRIAAEPPPAASGEVPEPTGGPDLGASNPARSAEDPGELAIGPASRELGLHARTLMAYERIGLVRPRRRSGRRVYSRNELRWLACVQDLNRPGGVGLRGLSVLRRFVPCWAIREQLEEGGEAVPDGTAAEGLARLARACEGTAPARCRECGVYQAEHAETKAAWDAEVAHKR
jgi:MerR family transcriptional regulator/heat shock protein HspR